MINIESPIIVELREATRSRASWRHLQPVLANPAIGLHLAVMSEPFLGYMLEGKKAIESRFSNHKIAPYGSIKAGDLVFLKQASGPVVAYFQASKVEFVELHSAALHRIQQAYGTAICAGETFWRQQEGRRYATLIAIEGLQPLRPLRIEKRDRRGWVRLR